MIDRIVRALSLVASVLLFQQVLELRRRLDQLYHPGIGCPHYSRRRDHVQFPCARGDDPR